MPTTFVVVLLLLTDVDALDEHPPALGVLQPHQHIDQLADGLLVAYDHRADPADVDVERHRRAHASNREVVQPQADHAAPAGKGPVAIPIPTRYPVS
ncbi:hypothetical protein GCM10023317_87130 [Actinopolymorpha pittospori]